MELISLSFFYLLLPAGLLLYLPTPARYRPGLLLLISLVMVFLMQPSALLLLLFSMIADFIAIQLMNRFDRSTRFRRGIFAFSVVKSLVLLFYAGVLAQMQSQVVVLGAAVYTLLGIDCVLSAYRRELPLVKNPVCFGLYYCFFPRLVAGPLQQYDDFDAQLDRLHPTGTGMLEGLTSLLSGALKVRLFGEFLTALYETLRSYVHAEPSALAGWCMVLALALSVYYRFSGWCDMARGIGLLFGLRLPLNFYYPYQSRGIQDFLERFHSTLWRFLDRAVYKSFLQGGKNGPLADTLNLLVLGMLFGLWFGLQPGYLAWGAMLGLFAAAERHFLRGFFSNLPTLFQRIYALLVILLSFTFFAADSIPRSLAYFRCLFPTSSVPVYNPRIIYLLSTNWLLLVLSLFFATNVTNLVNLLLKKNTPGLYKILTLTADVVMLGALTALLV